MWLAGGGTTADGITEDGITDDGMTTEGTTDERITEEGTTEDIDGIFLTGNVMNSYAVVGTGSGAA